MGSSAARTWSQCSLTSTRIGQFTVQVNVGNDKHKKTFSIHDAVLCSGSEFFKRALNGTWKESEERVINLPEDDPDVFSLYVHCLYTGKLAVVSKPERYQEQFTKLARLYVFAEKIQDTKCKNYAVDAMVARIRGERIGSSPDASVIEIIYKGTARPCPARRLMVDIWTYHRPLNWDDHYQQSDFPPEFIWNLLCRMSYDCKKPEHNTVAECEPAFYHEPNPTDKENDQTNRWKLN